MSMRARIANFVKERNEVLFSLDRDRIEAYLIRRGCVVPENDIVFWAGVYKSICNITDAPAELVQKAQDWLHAHGMSERINLQYSPAIH